MGFVEKTEQVMVGAVMLLVLGTFLAGLNSDLTTVFTNTETQPNGSLVLTVIALLTVAVAVAILLKVFKNDDEPPPSFARSQFQ